MQLFLLDTALDVTLRSLTIVNNHLASMSFVVGGDPTIADLGEAMSATLENLDASLLGPGEPKTIPADVAVKKLQRRLGKFFHSDKVLVKLADGIASDAAAGADYLKIRSDGMFNERDLKVLEVHEGHVHIGTTLNGLAQPVCTFLAKGPPSSTITQEGLAIIMEIISFNSYPARLKRITNRIHAIDMAEQGADFDRVDPQVIHNCVEARDVVGVLQPDRQADEIRGHARRQLLCS